VSDHLRGETSLEVARFVLFSAEMYRTFAAALAGSAQEELPPG